MSVKIAGNTTNTDLEIDNTSKAARVTLYNSNGTEINAGQMTSAVLFTTTSNLGPAGTYDSGIITLLPDYNQVQTNVLSDQDGTIQIYWYSDALGADLVRTLTLPYDSTKGYQSFAAPAAFGAYVKYTYTNDAIAQGDFYYTTLASQGAQSPQMLNLEAPVSPKMMSAINRSILMGTTEGGDYYQNVSIDGLGHLEVGLQGPVSAFGDLSTVSEYPVVQIDFVYGVNVYTTNSRTSGGGQVTGQSGMAFMRTTAVPNAYAQIDSVRYLKYRSGQGGRAKFTAVFSTGVAGSKQYAGAFTTSLNNGYGFGFDGATFGIWYIKGGVPTHIPQTDWNSDKMNGANGEFNKSGMDLEPTFGNVFQIKYQYLGFGNIKFYVENSLNGQFVLVHEIKYANTYTVPSLSQPSLSLVWRVENVANATDMKLYAGSGSLFIEGERKFNGPVHGRDNNKLAVTTETNIIALRNATTYNGSTNRSHIRLRTISFATNTGGAGNGISTLSIIRNPTLGGVPVFTPVNGATADNGVTITSGNSIASVDTAGTTITGGTVIFNTIIGVGNNYADDITELDLFAYPGDTLAFAVKSTQSATVGVGLTWTDDL